MGSEANLPRVSPRQTDASGMAGQRLTERGGNGTGVERDSPMGG